MGIQRCSHGFRARVKKDGRTFNGPIRETEADAEEDEIQYKQAAAESLEKLQAFSNAASDFHWMGSILQVPQL